MVGLCGAAALFGAPASCSAPFDPPSLVNSLRVLGVEIDKPYAEPGDEVTFTMYYTDPRVQESVVPTLIVWVGGCWNPPGKQYYGCYESLGQVFSGLSEGGPLPEGLIAAGVNLTEFKVTVPDDAVSSLADPDTGPKVGIGFVFFILCAGELRFVEQEGETAAGSFPLGCFDGSGAPVGPEGFLPGYTQVYVFEDGRTNANPVVNALTVDGDPYAPETPPTVPRCDVSAEERRKSGCAATDEFTECEAVEIDVDVPDDIAEIDPEAVDIEGDPLNEVVWVSYFADGGDFQSGIRLVSDAREGIQGEHHTEWVPPDEVGTYTIWAVVRDNRGGSRVLSQLVQVTE
jgi:hypothetical protein